MKNIEIYEHALERIQTKQAPLKVKRVSNGVNIYSTDGNIPVARLKPANENLVEIKYWSHRERWEAIGEFGGVFLSLDDSIDYVLEDELNCFMGYMLRAIQANKAVVPRPASWARQIFRRLILWR